MISLTYRKKAKSGWALLHMNPTQVICNSLQVFTLDNIVYGIDQLHKMGEIIFKKKPKDESIFASQSIRLGWRTGVDAHIHTNIYIGYYISLSYIECQMKTSA